MKLIAKDVCKKIGNKDILKNIDLELESGKIYGFVGRNGSGKTMLFRALSGLMSVSSGEVIYDGKVLKKDMNVLPNLGIIIENAGLYPELTGFDNLKLLTKLNKNVDNERIKSIISMVGLDPDDKRKYSKYSLGMKQRIVIAQALMESPEVLMLDEPTNALDEDGVTMVRDLIKKEKEKGSLVLIASHNKEDIEFLADEVYRIKDGQILEREK
ncbi:ABC-2 type transport system ATP-binding protein [Eubacterium uniforme]|uniref:ABC-2 type transport system ATP-binding protein n=1 Tax=Eubacterium uniforme TaxID=39495 RepID=A0A1T4VL48_9FIRM|nr:ABC transporter ATP-binding protein [Eubacterium uniforme]SKA65694.1 ABC-2 type transport system ATP-binding protein [Eubacterium uniforme]